MKGERDQDDIKGKLNFHCIRCSFPGLSNNRFYILEAVKNWTMGRPGKDATTNQVCSNLLPPHPTK